MKRQTGVGVTYGLALIVGLGVLAGCNRSQKLPVEQGVIVKAKILKGGQPLPAKDESGIPGMESIQPYQISLVPVGAGAEAHQRGEYVGIYDSNGIVTFVGPGKGIPPGVYKMVIVSSAMPLEEGAGDPLGGRFNRENTPLQFTVTVSNLGKEQDLGTIDLDNPPK